MWYLQATSPSEPSGLATCAAEGECMQCRGRSPWSLRHAPTAAPAPVLLQEPVQLADPAESKLCQQKVDLLLV